MDRNDRAVVGLATVGHASVHTFELAIPLFIPLWLAEFQRLDLGVAAVPFDAAVAGVLVTVGYGLFGVGALPGGVLADRVGSKRLIVASLFGMSASFVVLAAAPSVLAVGAALACWGVAASVYHPAGLSMLSRAATERGRAFAYHGIAGNLGIALGPFVVAVALVVADWRTVALALAAPILVVAALATRIDVDERAAVGSDGDGQSHEATASDGGAEIDSETTDSGGADRTSSVESFADFRVGSRELFVGGFALIFPVVVASGLYYRGILTFLPEVLSTYDAFAAIAVGDLSLETYRYAYAGLLAVGVVGQYAGGRVSDHVRPERALAPAFLGLAVLAVLFLPAVALGVGPFLVLGGLLGVALFFVQPLYQAAVADHTPPGTRGLSYGYTYLGVFGVGALGGAVAGGILEYANAAALFATLGAVALAGAVAAFTLARRGG
ncbi:MFS transporter [Halorubellus sp. JP-L1]|uniref:MFS transporter n=1 Tax=Halorubellus sp. JP-L1 TaxID=2715753 RepID=UPI00140E00D5|nr:MFS transporter [Halorubellus sp. JP-L1]